MALKVLAWNIMHGGGGRRAPDIALELLERDADVILLCEYRRSVGGQIRAVLSDHGWTHQATTDPPPGKNGMLVVSRIAIEPGPPPPPGVPEHRWLEVRVADGHGDGRIGLIGLHIPDDGQPRVRREFWRALLGLAAHRRDEPVLVLGDLNTTRRGEGGHAEPGPGPGPGRGRVAPFEPRGGGEFLGRLCSLGYVDACHAGGAGREATWVSHAGNGFRIDHAFVSAPLAGRLVSASYAHDARGRGVSDHSILELALS